MTPHSANPASGPSVGSTPLGVDGTSFPKVLREPLPQRPPPRGVPVGVVVNNIPNDLMPLPTMPYSERPVSLPLDVEECRTALWRAGGSIADAAKLLKCASLRLRQFVNKSPYLSAEMQEAKDQIVDIAEKVVVDALTDEDDPGRRDTMARFVLGSQGRSRGWGSGSGGANVNIKNAGGTIVVQWADGTHFGDAAPNNEKMVDVTPDAAA